MKRRDFLRMAAGTAPALWLGGCAVEPPPARPGAAGGRTLVLVELRGGNDGLNTVVPYADPEYRRLRPGLAVPRETVAPLDERLGLHPDLAPLLPLWRQKRLAIALGVGYPEPNQSHFRSIDIWDTASDAAEVIERGWVARLREDPAWPTGLAVDGVVLGANSAGPLHGGGVAAVNLSNPDSFVRQAGNPVPAGSAPAATLAHVLAVQRLTRDTARALVEHGFTKTTFAAEFPKSPLGQQLRTAARLIVTGFPAPVLKAELGGFDTHGDQAEKHALLLAQLAEALAAFERVLTANGRWDAVLVMTYSEFGRRAAENGSRGTDHGTAAPHFLAGGRVKGGLYGEQPPLADLDAGNLRHRLHFRSLYATAADWLGAGRGAFREKPLACLA